MQPVYGTLECMYHDLYSGVLPFLSNKTNETMPISVTVENDDDFESQALIGGKNVDNGQ